MQEFTPNFRSQRSGRLREVLDVLVDGLEHGQGASVDHHVPDEVAEQSFQSSSRSTSSTQHAVHR